MDIVKLLPDSVANQIAAGEVIQRPASVIKELVENAVDAGATDISIAIKDAGKTLIQVIDNGCGMTETDARMAFERHATSKIRSADDLFTLQTMGFRGEALPSICAIAEVEVKTCTADAPIGTRIVIKGSHVELQEPEVCARGTVISVRKLFYNVPARRKFMRSDNVELSNIMREFERLALVNNHIRMRIDTGIRTIDLSAGVFRHRIEELWKNSLKGEQLIPVNVETSLVKIEGFVSRPEYARRRNWLQYLIVNGRNMKNPYFHKSIMGCYDSLISSDTQPCYFLKFTVDPASIDVNIHPTKNEIKFEYGDQIWAILHAAVKAALGKYGAVPSIDFETDAIPLDPLRDGEVAKQPSMGYRADYNPFKSAGASHTSATKNWERLYESLQKESDTVSQEAMLNTPRQQQHEEYEKLPLTQTDDDKNSASRPGAICLQYATKYIITTSRSGVIIIDQHRAHVKVLYEEYLRQMDNMEIVSQRIMFPETITLDGTQQAAYSEIEEDLKRMGFILEYESDTTWKIVSLPAMIHNTDPKDVIYRILDSVTEDSRNYGKESAVNTENALTQSAALVMARSAAIRRGTKLTNDEMEHLIGQLFSLPDPSYTPNGNLIFTTLGDDKLATMLG